MSIRNIRPKAYLLLQNGEIYEGESMGATGTTVGELVFNTGMTGYQQLITDTSYNGQIVVHTYPLIGNCGINTDDMESKRIWIKGYIVRECCEVPSNFRSIMDLESYLKNSGIIGLCGIDTRKLTRTIRDHGVMNAVITTEDVYKNKEALLAQSQAYQVADAVAQVSVKSPEAYTAKVAKYKVVMWDFGYKKSVLDSLLSYGCDVVIVPCTATAEEILAYHPDGIMLSDGPGDPAGNLYALPHLRTLYEQKIPFFGIGLTHQMMAMALGAKTTKLKYGHRGANQPVYELATGKIHTTTQNHGYEVIVDTLDMDKCLIGFENVNDKSCEGIIYKNSGSFTVQFEAQPFLFDKFCKLMAR